MLAIDPGRHGGYAAAQLGRTWAGALAEADGERAVLLAELQAGAALEGQAVVCVLEKVGGFTGKGRPGSAMFNFGEGYGFLLGVLAALKVKVHLVTPQVWQKPLALGTRRACASDTIWKRKLKEEAQRRFPHIKVTNANADALLILEHAACRMPEIFL